MPGPRSHAHARVSAPCPTFDIRTSPFDIQPSKLFLTRDVAPREINPILRIARGEGDDGGEVLVQFVGQVPIGSDQAVLQLRFRPRPDDDRCDTAIVLQPGERDLGR